MKPMKMFYVSAILLAAIAACTTVMADDAIDADDFVGEASAKGLAEVETGKLALEKSSSPTVKQFAQTMIDDHTKANQELTLIARNKNLDLAADPELMNKTKAFILKQRDGESFDKAYANNQVMAHEQTISLFQKATRMKDAELKAFAQKTLPKLQHHLQMAKQLAADTGAETDTDHGVGTGTGGTDIDNDAGIRTQPRAVE